MTDSADAARRPRLSVAMIVRDEQQVLAASLESVRAIADEIVVLDTGSTDQSMAIARRFGAVVRREPFDDDFSAARNCCLKHVKGEWVLWLDAGERLERESAADLRHFVDEKADPAKVYWVLVQVPPAGTTQGGATACGEQITQLRLAPNRPELRFEGRIRETLRPSLEAARMEIDAAPGRIVRHHRQHDPARKAELARRNLRLAALQLAEGDGRPLPRLRLAMGEAYSELGDQDAARREFLQALEDAEHGSTDMLEAYYGLLASYQTQKLFGQLQLTTCLEALEVFPLDAQLLLLMGNHLLSNNRTDLAIRSFETAVRYGRIDPETWHLSQLADVACDCLHVALQMQGRDQEARCVLEEALQGNPGSTRLRRRLIDLHIKHGRAEDAIGLAGQLPLRAALWGPLGDAIRGACKAAQGDWTPALGYLQSAYVAGCHDPLCLRWLAVTLLSNGQIEAARPVLSHWQRLEPDNVELRRYLAATERHPELEAADLVVSADRPSGEPAGRQFRIDQGTSVLHVAPTILPIISQASSADAVGQSDSTNETVGRL